MIKTKIHERLLALVTERIEVAQLEIKAAQEGKANETKSSAGDKYETGRAMLQMEHERNAAQLAKAKAILHELNCLNPAIPKQNAEPGSLISTTLGNYYISVGLGAIVINDATYYAISLASPIGQALSGKRISDEFTFNGESATILDVC